MSFNPASIKVFRHRFFPVARYFFLQSGLIKREERLPCMHIAYNVKAMGLGRPYNVIKADRSTYKAAICESL